MLARELVAHGAPTLARLKVGSLFNIAYDDADSLMDEMDAINRAELMPKGVMMTLLRLRDHKALIYLYRIQELEQELARPDVQDFLRLGGYDVFTVDAVLNHLRARLMRCAEFPHEIGVFLGYPLSDVVAFIDNEGQNYLCSGCWKAYSNEYEAQRIFQRIRKCKEVYMHLFASGFPLSRLTVKTQMA